MITAISPIGESYRLSQNGTHQSLVLTLQAEANGLKINASGVILEISQMARQVAALAKEENNRQKVKPVERVLLGNSEYHLKR